MRKPLPFGAQSEIVRRLAKARNPRAVSHVSRVVSGERTDPVVEKEVERIIREGWTRDRRKSA